MALNDRSRTPPAGEIELHIEELVLHGFNAKDGARLQGEIERELSRLLMQGGFSALTQQSMDVERVNAGTLHLPANPRPRVVGRRIAQQLYSHISQTPSAAPAERKGARSVR